jgi:hypothetical protein
MAQATRIPKLTTHVSIGYAHAGCRRKKRKKEEEKRKSEGEEMKIACHELEVLLENVSDGYVVRRKEGQLSMYVFLLS